jgi:uncharacterized membrane protein
VKAVLVLALVVACDPAPLTMDEHPCPPGGTPLTYDNFGRGFLDDNCNRCHSAEEGSRHGAPVAYRFDTVDDVRAHAARMFVRAAGPNVSMPPGPEDPPADARDQLADWLSCGAP